MREIGSEFWDVPRCDDRNFLFPNGTEWFLSGRSALKAIVQEIKDKTKSVSLPSWCCDSIISPFLEVGIEVTFYPVFGAEQHLENITTDAILLMDFFGYTGYSHIENYNGIIIRDVTHSLFSRQYDDADYYFGSLRKWAGFWTGGYAWGFKRLLKELPMNEEYVRLRQKAMEDKRAYIEWRTYLKEFLNTFLQAEAMLDNCGIEGMARRDYDCVRTLDAQFIRDRRRSNASILLEAFEEDAVFKDFKKQDCPMFVPIIVPDGQRNALRQYLIEHQIYCPVHWPVTEVHRLRPEEQFIYDNELSLVCDQRYDGDDMHRIINTIYQFLAQTSC